jgi:hypothetical protein
MMTNTHCALDLDERSDDLPRALRREREARRRGTFDPSFKLLTASGLEAERVGGFEGVPPSVPGLARSFEVPFLRLVLFFIKAIFAAVPAIIVLGVMLWFAGHMLQEHFPHLVKMQILIRFLN